jgi:hypothetical protein
MGPRPTKPNPLGNAPKVGYENPNFPTIGQREPEGTYRSQIDTRRTFGNPVLRGLIMDTPVPGRASNTRMNAAAPSVAANSSRSAFSRALTDKTNSALDSAMEEYDVQRQSQAEKSRGDDVLAQRQNVFDTFKLNKFKDVYDTDVLTGFDQKILDLSAYYERERKNSKAMITAAALRGIGSVLGMI